MVLVVDYSMGSANGNWWGNDVDTFLGKSPKMVAGVCRGQIEPEREKDDNGEISQFCLNFRHTGCCPHFGTALRGAFGAA